MSGEAVAMVAGSLEQAVTFDCEGERLVGIVHLPERANGCAVLVVVGGPQYRIGSHRQFLLLARRLAGEGFTVLRFDYRGMGDSGGELLGFEHIGADIEAALSALGAHASDVRCTVGLGLCDAASALLIHPQARKALDALVLLNPWVTEGDSDAAAMVNHYYRARLGSSAFWSKLVRGQVDVYASARGALRALLARVRRGRSATGNGAGADALASLSERMASGLAASQAMVLLVTSGQDLTAAEFLERARASTAWQRELAAPRLRHVHMAEANHTFSSAAWRAEVENVIIEWLNSLPAVQGGQ